MVCRQMSESLEKAAGAKMRSILAVFTKNRFIGLLVGMIFTAIIQSSNATTVMVVSFVDLRTDESDAGNRNYSGSQYRNYNHRTVDRA